MSSTEFSARILELLQVVPVALPHELQLAAATYCPPSATESDTRRLSAKIPWNEALLNDARRQLPGAALEQLLAGMCSRGEILRLAIESLPLRIPVPEPFLIWFGTRIFASPEVHRDARPPQISKNTRDIFCAASQSEVATRLVSSHHEAMAERGLQVGWKTPLLTALRLAELAATKLKLLSRIRPGAWRLVIGDLHSASGEQAALLSEIRNSDLPILIGHDWEDEDQGWTGTTLQTIAAARTRESTLTNFSGKLHVRFVDAAEGAEICRDWRKLRRCRGETRTQVERNLLARLGTELEVNEGLLLF